MTEKITKIYKLIAHPAEDKQPRLPFYGYTVEDPEGNTLISISKLTFTLEPDKYHFGRMTFIRTLLDENGNPYAETIEDVEAEIDVREPREQIKEQIDDHKERLEKIKAVLENLKYPLPTLKKNTEENKSKVSLTNISLTSSNKLAVGKELLRPIIETIDYESASGKLFTEAKDLKTPEVKLSVSLDKLSMFGFVPDDVLAKEQDRARQQLEYQQDMAAIDLLRQEPIICSNFEDGVGSILAMFKRRNLNCTHICIPRVLVVDIVNYMSDKIDPVHQRELVMAGYIGSLKDTETQFVTTAGTNVFEVLNTDEFFGIDSTRCKREYSSPLTCVKDGEHIKFEGGIKFEVDPDAVVWAKINK